MNLRRRGCKVILSLDKVRKMVREAKVCPKDHGWRVLWSSNLHVKSFGLHAGRNHFLSSTPKSKPLRFPECCWSFDCCFLGTQSGFWHKSKFVDWKISTVKYDWRTCDFTLLGSKALWGSWTTKRFEIKILAASTKKPRLGRGCNIQQGNDPNHTFKFRQNGSARTESNV